jgi:hypothetical protein
MPKALRRAGLRRWEPDAATLAEDNSFQNEYER